MLELVSISEHLRHARIILSQENYSPLLGGFRLIYFNCNPYITRTLYEYGVVVLSGAGKPRESSKKTMGKDKTLRRVVGRPGVSLNEVVNSCSRAANDATQRIHLAA